jgi:hypothetical protein
MQLLTPWLVWPRIMYCMNHSAPHVLPLQPALQHPPFVAVEAALQVGLPRGLVVPQLQWPVNSNRARFRRQRC